MIVVEHLKKAFVSKAGSAHSPLTAKALWQALAGKTPKTWVQAVSDVSFSAANGAITGLLGPNGAGKTTSLRMLAGLIEPDGGTMHVDGIDVRAHGQQTLQRMGLLSDARGLYPRLSACENIAYHGRLHGLSADAAQARARSLGDLLDMNRLMDRRVEGFSQGERMKVSLARAIVHDPANIVLDEPTNGLDVVATRALREVLRHLRSPEGGGKCIVLSTHIMQEVERLCDNVYIVSNGRTVANASVPELLAQTQQTDFEEAFVQLAFASASPAGPLIPQDTP